MDWLVYSIFNCILLQCSMAEDDNSASSMGRRMSEVHCECVCHHHVRVCLTFDYDGWKIICRQGSRITNILIARSLIFYVTRSVLVTSLISDDDVVMIDD